MRRVAWIIVAGLLLALWAWPRGVPAPAADAARTPAGLPAADTGNRALPGFLPREAHDTLRLVAQGGPYPYRQDGGTFHNRERLLPPRPHGYYREFTVATPGAHDRGARRLVSGGGDPGRAWPREFFYSDDHYRSFRRFEAPAGTGP